MSAPSASGFLPGVAEPPPRAPPPTGPKGRMEEAVARVGRAGAGGLAMSALTWWVLEQEVPHPNDLDERRRKRLYKKAAGVVDRIVRDRLVRHDATPPKHWLYAWDVKQKAYAETLERALFAAPDLARRAEVQPLAVAAWRAAGDDARARSLDVLMGPVT